MSVILPVRNAAAWLPAQLHALVGQRYAGCWEVLVADNGSTDRTAEIARAWADRLALRVVDASDRVGINAARNRAAQVASGDLLVFCDGDDVVGPGWLAAMADAARHHDLVGGQLDENLLNPMGTARRPRMPAGRLPVALGFLPFAVGANLAVWADVLEQLGGFDERFVQGNDDVELSFRAQVRGLRLGYAGAAVVHYRHRRRHRELFHQFMNYGRSEPLLFAMYRRWGMSRAGVRPVLRRWARIAVEAPSLVFPSQRAGWVVLVGFTLGRLHGSFRHRTLYL